MKTTALALPRPIFLLLYMVCLSWPGPAGAQPPSPLDGSLFAFPGFFENPHSAASAGVALADRWLGEEPYSNPAALPRSCVVVSPALIHVSRQDLRADNRNFDETAAFFDGSGAALGVTSVPGFETVGFWLYAFQPAMRLEENAFTRGRIADPSVQPAVIQSRSVTREARAGLASSAALGDWRVGAAFEWSFRDDVYETVETSGNPGAGFRRLAFDGNAPGFQIGARWRVGATGELGDTLTGIGAPHSRAYVVGAAIRYLPSLAVSAEQRLELASGDSLGVLPAEREAGWEGGVSARALVSPGVHVLAGLGARTERAWQGFSLVEGARLEWRLALEYRDPEEPWTARLGFGQERVDQAPEPRATVLGLGLGWKFEGTTLDIAALRRGIQRDDSPTSYEDRVLATLRMEF